MRCSHKHVHWQTHCVDLSATISNLMWGRGIAPVPSNNNRDAFRLGQFGIQAVEVALILGTSSCDRAVPGSAPVSPMESHGLIGRSHR